MQQDDTGDVPQLIDGYRILLEDYATPNLEFTTLGEYGTFSLPEQLADGSDESESLPATEILSSRSRHVTPISRAEDVLERQFDHHRAADSYSSQTIQCSEVIVMTVRSAMARADEFSGYQTSRSATKSRISRFLNAYFEYFDPHTPIVHQSSFNMSSTPGIYQSFLNDAAFFAQTITPEPLLLAMLSIGGCYLSEHEFAYQLYEAACHLLSRVSELLFEDTKLYHLIYC
jgi:hypothetical protein